MGLISLILTFLLILTFTLFILRVIMLIWRYYLLSHELKAANAARTANLTNNNPPTNITDAQPLNSYAIRNRSIDYPTNTNINEVVCCHMGANEIDSPPSYNEAMKAHSVTFQQWPERNNTTKDIQFSKQ